MEANFSLMCFVCSRDEARHILQIILSNTYDVGIVLCQVQNIATYHDIILYMVAKISPPRIQRSSVLTIFRYSDSDSLKITMVGSRHHQKRHNKF